MDLYKSSTLMLRKLPGLLLPSLLAAHQLTIRSHKIEISISPYSSVPRFSTPTAGLSGLPSLLRTMDLMKEITLSMLTTWQ